MNWFIPVVLLLVFLADLAAQEIPPVAPGTRVRVEVLSDPSTRNLSPIYKQSNWVTGSLVSLGVDTLVIKSEGREVPMMISRSYIGELEVSEGRRESTRGMSAAMGAGIGFFPGGAMLTLYADEVDLDSSGIFIMGGLSGALLGAITGTIVASQDTQKAWNQVGIGAATGSLTFLLLASLAYGPGNYSMSAVEPIMLGTLGGALVGALIGTVAKPSERWKPVPLPFRVGLLPHGGGYVALCFEFGK